MAIFKIEIFKLPGFSLTSAFDIVRQSNTIGLVVELSLMTSHYRLSQLLLLNASMLLVALSTKFYKSEYTDLIPNSIHTFLSGVPCGKSLRSLTFVSAVVIYFGCTSSSVGN